MNNEMQPDQNEESIEVEEKQINEPDQPSKKCSTWIHGLFLLLFLIIWGFIKTIIVFVMLFQFIHTLFRNTQNQRLIKLGRILCQYGYQIMLFLTYYTTEKPYPFNDWPSEDR